MRILEFPGYATFAQPFPNTIPYSESIGFIADLRDEDDVDYVFYVTAHEIAHQWWAHQVIGADVQGVDADVARSLAQYSALMVMEQEYGARPDAQVPAATNSTATCAVARRASRARNCRCTASRTSPTSTTARARWCSTGCRGNRRGQRSIARSAATRPTRPSSSRRTPPRRELLGELRAEAGPEQQQLITDLFERISFYDNRVEEVQVEALEGGRYALTLKLHAAKFEADGVGKETAAADG